MTTHHSDCRCPRLAPVPTLPVVDRPAGCFCAQPWNAVTPPPPCATHTTTLAWYGGVHALERSLLRKLLGTSFLAHTDVSPRLFFTADWMDLSAAEAALLQSLEL